MLFCQRYTQQREWQPESCLAPHPIQVRAKPRHVQLCCPHLLHMGRSSDYNAGRSDHDRNCNVSTKTGPRHASNLLAWKRECQLEPRGINHSKPARTPPSRHPGVLNTEVDADVDRLRRSPVKRPKERWGHNSPHHRKTGRAARLCTLPAATRGDAGAQQTDPAYACGQAITGTSVTVKFCTIVSGSWRQ